VDFNFIVHVLDNLVKKNSCAFKNEVNLLKLIANDYEAKDIMKIIREWTNLKQTDFGESINRSSRTVQDYEAGITNYSMKMLLDIAKKYRITITLEKK